MRAGREVRLTMMGGCFKGVCVVFVSYNIVVVLSVDSPPPHFIFFISNFYD